MRYLKAKDEDWHSKISTINKEKDGSKFFNQFQINFDFIGKTSWYLMYMHKADFKTKKVPGLESIWEQRNISPKNANILQLKNE